MQLIRVREGVGRELGEGGRIGGLAVPVQVRKDCALRPMRAQS